MAGMTFKEYSLEAIQTGDYPSMGGNLIYPALGLAGEAGEAADKIKKLWRNNNQTKGLELEIKDRHQLALELGDVLWYINALAYELGIGLADIAELNLEKLHDRVKRGVVKGEGDNR